MKNKKKSDDFKFGSIDYYKLRITELEQARDEAQRESGYYQTELAKAHEILGRVIHQLSERWDTVNLTKYYPTDNLWHKRTVGNSSGIKLKEE